MQSVKEAKVAARAAELDRLGIEHVPCDVCGVPTTKSTRPRCYNCSEVESRLRGYLRDGDYAAFDFVSRVLQETQGDTITEGAT
jgi:hypothetical protein